jgi:hypothetical protein
VSTGALNANLVGHRHFLQLVQRLVVCWAYLALRCNKFWDVDVGNKLDALESIVEHRLGDETLELLGEVNVRSGINLEGDEVELVGDISGRVPADLGGVPIIDIVVRIAPGCAGARFSNRNSSRYAACELNSSPFRCRKREVSRGILGLNII